MIKIPVDQSWAESIINCMTTNNFIEDEKIIMEAEDEKEKTFWDIYFTRHQLNKLGGITFEMPSVFPVHFWITCTENSS